MHGSSGGVDVAVVDAGDVDAARLADALAEHEPALEPAVLPDADALPGGVDEAVDVVLAPAGTPTMEGTALLAAVRERTDAPVVVVDGESADVSSLLEAGAADCVELPRDRGAERLVANRVRLVAERAEADDDAREAWRRYRRLLDASPAPMAIHDHQGELLYVNERATAVAGAETRGEVVGRSVLSFVPEAGESQVRTALERVVEDREPLDRCEVDVVGLDGRERVVECSSTPVTVDGDPAGQLSLVDVTELKERERRLREERDRFTTLFESVPEPAVHVGFVDGEPVARNVNPAFEEVFGFEADAAAGESLVDLVVPEEAAEEAAEFGRMARDGEEIEREVRRLTADGEREFLFRARPVECAGDGAESLGIYVDITEQKRREVALQRQNDRLDTFASIVSHDLKGPLSVAKGNLALVDDDGHVRKADQALDRMERIIDRLLRLARAGEEGTDPEPVPASEAVATAWVALDDPSGDLDDEWEGTVRADRGQLRELLENLFRNALQHGATGARTAAGVAADEEAEADASTGDGVEVEVGGTADGFYVADDGPGIPPGDREKVFEAGYTTAEDGTGFGLVVVEEIAEAHGWDVAVTDSDAGGARFEFTGVEYVDADGEEPTPG